MSQTCFEISSISSSRYFFRVIYCEKDAAVRLEISEGAQILQYVLWEDNFLGVFAKLPKATFSFVMSVRPSARMDKLGSHRTDFLESSYLSIFRKSVEKIQVTLKCDKNKGYLTRRPMCIYDSISPNSS